MNILVTGAGGYIGNVLTRTLLDSGYKVSGLDMFHFGDDLLPDHENLRCVKGDIRNVSSSIFEGVDAVIDLAAISNDPAGELNPTTTISINHLGRLRIATLAKVKGVKRYILPSSASVYGFSDNISDENSNTNPLTTYAEANLLAEKDILELADDCFTVTVLRQSTVFGLSKRMRFDLAINGMTKGFIKNGKIPILKDGSQWRPFVHVKDTCRAMIAILNSDISKVQGEIFNVGSNSLNYQILPLAKEVARGSEKEFKYEWYGDPDHRSYRLDFSKISSLGYETKHTVADGANEVARAISDNTVDPHDPKTITLKWYKHLIDSGVKI